MLERVYRVGDYVPNGDLVVMLIQLYQVPLVERGPEWVEWESAVRAVLNQQESKVLEGEVRVEVLDL